MNSDCQTRIVILPRSFLPGLAIISYVIGDEASGHCAAGPAITDKPPRAAAGPSWRGPEGPGGGRGLRRQRLSRRHCGLVPEARRHGTVTNVIGGMTARTSAGLPVCRQLIIAGRERIAMALWLVTASWTDDEAELTQQWEVNVPTEEEAVREVTMLLPARPHHVEVKPLSDSVAPDLVPGQVRKLS
jgi:hypothetical protein